MYVCGDQLVCENVKPFHGIGVAVRVTAIVAEADVRIVLVAILDIGEISHHTQILKG